MELADRFMAAFEGSSVAHGQNNSRKHKTKRQDRGKKVSLSESH